MDEVINKGRPPTNFIAINYFLHFVQISNYIRFLYSISNFSEWNQIPWRTTNLLCLFFICRILQTTWLLWMACGKFKFLSVLNFDLIWSLSWRDLKLHSGKVEWKFSVWLWACILTSSGLNLPPCSISIIIIKCISEY